MPKKHTETVDSKLKTAWQVVSRMYNAEAALHNATIAMAHFLLNVDSTQGSYASDIAPQLGMEQTSLTRLINSLEEKELIVRETDKDDRRKTLIRLTAKGIAQKNEAKEVVRDFNKQLEARIGAKKISALFKTIDQIVEIAEERYRSNTQNGHETQNS
ncbi:MAG: MarR family winged helix-turn-helix transcriptional regulator [Bacteroidia bacterium]|jgi:DNA-binding MarR family transcriptional regulator|nr:MarR family winged helix-turn-helix transcriptional regulator [Bacteroidia bacterium]